MAEILEATAEINENIGWFQYIGITRKQIERKLLTALKGAIEIELHLSIRFIRHQIQDKFIRHQIQILHIRILVIFSSPIK